MTVITNLKQLYEIDDSLWLEETIELLKHKQFNQLDLENLIEELEDLGSEKKNAVESILEQIIRHLLMCQYWTNEVKYSGNHWRAEIIGFRSQLERRLTTNLRNHLLTRLPKIYQAAFKYVNQKTGFLLDLPQQCPYTLEQLD
jgi:Fe-S-cluster formation regulator IscX/YfhJ